MRLKPHAGASVCRHLVCSCQTQEILLAPEGKLLFFCCQNLLGVTALTCVRESTVHVPVCLKKTMHGRSWASVFHANERKGLEAVI